MSESNAPNSPAPLETERLISVEEAIQILRVPFGSRRLAWDWIWSRGVVEKRLRYFPQKQTLYFSEEDDWVGAPDAPVLFRLNWQPLLEREYADFDERTYSINIPDLGEGPTGLIYKGNLFTTNWFDSDLLFDSTHFLEDEEDLEGDEGIKKLEGIEKIKREDLEERGIFISSFKMETENIRFIERDIQVWAGKFDDDGSVLIGGKNFTSALDTNHPSPAQKKTKRPPGRKPHPATDILWAEICFRVINGDLAKGGSSQRAIARDLADWLREQGKEMDEETIGDKVRLLFNKAGWR